MLCCIVLWTCVFLLCHNQLLYWYLVLNPETVTSYVLLVHSEYYCKAISWWWVDIQINEGLWLPKWKFSVQLVTFLQVLKIQGDTKKFIHELHKISENVDPVTVVVISISVNIYHYLWFYTWIVQFTNGISLILNILVMTWIEYINNKSV